MASLSSTGSLSVASPVPFITVVTESHSTCIIVVISIGLGAVLFLSVVGILDRISRMELDDWFLASSSASIAQRLVTILQSAVVLYGCFQGLGSTISDKSSTKLITTQKVYYASNLLFSVALGLSKISIAFLLRRINGIAGRGQVFTGAAAFVAGWTVASILALALQCDLRHPWITIGEHCPAVFLRWKVIGAFDIISELLLFASAVYLVSPVQAPWSTKATSVSVFFWRLQVILAVLCRLLYFDPEGLTVNPSNHEALFIAWTQIELYYSVITAVAILGELQFMIEFNTGLRDIKTGLGDFSTRLRDLNTRLGELIEPENLVNRKSQDSKESYLPSMLWSVDKDTINNTVSWGFNQEDGATNTYKARVLAADDVEARIQNSQKGIIRKDRMSRMEHD